MPQKIRLTNRENKYVVIDDHVFEHLMSDAELSSKGFLEKLRAHSNGYAFFQRYMSEEEVKGYETIYLHKYIAEKYIPKPRTDKPLFVRFLDSDVLNARIENLEWCTMNTLRRNMHTSSSSTGYRGVTVDRGKFRASLYHDGKKYELGFFDDAEEAARAYNRKSIELFGKTAGLNRLDDLEDMIARIENEQ